MARLLQFYRHLLRAFFAVALFACSPSGVKTIEYDGYAELVLEELGTEDYHSYYFDMLGLDQEIYQSGKQRIDKGNGSINVKVPVGLYDIKLEYFRGSELVYSADHCRNTIRNSIRKLLPGKNRIKINICDEQGILVNNGINDIPIEEVSAVKERSFFVRNAELYDHTGEIFVMRGVNSPQSSLYNQVYESLDPIKEFGFNTIKISWCADTLVRSRYCEAQDIYPVSELERILNRMRELRLVAILSLYNAANSDDPEDLQKLVEYLLKPQVKSILMRYRDMLLINIANAWHSSNDDKSTYVDSYQNAIFRLREAGLPHVLIIDAKGSRQDFSSISEYAADLLASDPNILLSNHMYQAFHSNNRIRSDFAAIRKTRIPFMVSEFSCSRNRSNEVVCDQVMEEAENPDRRVSIIASAFTGNAEEFSDIDVVDKEDLQTLTEWGEKLINSDNGIRATSEEACVFSASNCKKKKKKKKKR